MSNNTGVIVAVVGGIVALGLAFAMMGKSGRAAQVQSDYYSERSSESSGGTRRRNTNRNKSRRK